MVRWGKDGDRRPRGAQRPNDTPPQRTHTHTHTRTPHRRSTAPATRAKDTPRGFSPSPSSSEIPDRAVARELPHDACTSAARGYPRPALPSDTAHHTTPRAPAQLVPRNGLQYQWGGRGKPVANGGPRKPLLPCSNECRGGARLLHCPHVNRQPSRGPRCTKAPKVHTPLGIRVWEYSMKGETCNTFTRPDDIPVRVGLPQ